MLFFPEEQHRASCERDVVPPSSRRYSEMCDRSVVGQAVCVDDDRHAAARTRPTNPDRLTQHRSDTERVPHTAAKRPKAPGLHLERRRHRREGHCHEDLARTRLQDEHVILGQLAEHSPNLVVRNPERSRQLVDQRDPARHHRRLVHTRANVDTCERHYSDTLPPGPQRNGIFSELVRCHVALEHVALGHLRTCARCHLRTCAHTHVRTCR
jgi:hypothetical protein